MNGSREATKQTVTTTVRIKAIDVSPLRLSSTSASGDVNDSGPAGGSHERRLR
jgi:hypothetical protein